MTKKDEQAAAEQESAKDATQGVTKPESAPDETVPGGRYMVNGKLVDSEGAPVKK